MPISSRFCDHCDHAAVDDARHLIMQCPEMQGMRNVMFRELADSGGGVGNVILEAAPDTLLLLLGKEMEDQPLTASMMEFWSVAARHIANMYRSKLRMGIG